MFTPNFNNILVVDLETTINAPEPFFGASPAYPHNKVVACGSLHKHRSKKKQPKVEIEFTDDVDKLSVIKILNTAAVSGKSGELLLVGHNLSFDLHYILRNLELLNGVLKNVIIWDTMKFEHMDSNRSRANPSLEKTANKYGIPFEKDSEVSERFKLGIGSDKIDRDILKKYLEQDVIVTAKIFKRQLEKCVSNGAAYSNYMIEMMQPILTTTKMAHHGMPFDVSSAREDVKLLEAELEEHLKEMKRLWGEHNFNSPAQIKTLLWGGEFKTEELVGKVDLMGTPVLYKSGKRKGERVRVKKTSTEKVEGLVEKDSVVKSKIDRGGFPQDASASTLERLIRYSLAGTPVHMFCSILLETRKVAKSINTYYKPYIEFTVRLIETGQGGRIHPSYNHCATSTGRLSSSKPNMQNISNKGE